MAVGNYSGTVSFVGDVTKDVDVSASIADARLAVPALYDSLGVVANLSIQAISASTYRITSEFAVTEDYLLVVIGQAVTPTPSPAPAASVFSGPILARDNTYAQVRAKILIDQDLEDETFVTPNELIGYVNEGIKYAESEILKLDEDYFLTSMPIPLVTGKSAYDYPENIYAKKIRGIEYANGQNIYAVKKFRRRDKFGRIALAAQYNETDDYRWYGTNDSAGQMKINLIPPARETAIVPPSPASFTPMTAWYIRRASRIPLIGEYLLNWEKMDAVSAVDYTTDQIAATGTYVTGDKVKLRTSDTLPGGLTPNTVYYVIAGAGFIKLASTLALARAGTAINLTSTGLGIISISIAATLPIVDNILIDIPEFVEVPIQWAKCRVLDKESDPRLGPAGEMMKSLLEQMSSSLSESEQDDDNEVEPDFSSYTDMS